MLFGKFRSLQALVLAVALAGCATEVPSSSAPLSVPPPAAELSQGRFVELASGKYSRGPRNAPVTIVEFADYECPFCKVDQDVLERLMTDYPGKLRLVFRDYPVGHPHSVVLAAAARCAGEQDGFWKLHDYEFRNMNQLDTEHLGKYGSTLGLDGTAIDACIRSQRYQTAIAADAAMAEGAGARGTPTFFVNGRMLDGMQTYEQLKAAVDEALAASGNTAPTSAKPAGSPG